MSRENPPWRRCCFLLIVIIVVVAIYLTVQPSALGAVLGGGISRADAFTVAAGTFGGGDENYVGTSPEYSIPPRPALYSDPNLIVKTKDNTLERLYARGKALTGTGEPVKLSSALSPVEGKHIYDIVRAGGFTKTLEIGFANGVSTVYIAQAVRDNGGGTHVAIDPNQMTQWKGAGIRSVRDAGLDDIVEWVKGDSTIVLPRFLSEGKRFQFILVDGLHLYDYTLIDFFFASRLLEVGGVVCMDDIRHPAVADWLRYAKRNYPHLRFEPRTLAGKTMATFTKMGEDSRKWNFHAGVRG
jgi:predicted O-methyltransferase YrrM